MLSTTAELYSCSYIGFILLYLTNCLFDCRNQTRHYCIASFIVCVCFIILSLSSYFMVHHLCIFLRSCHCQRLFKNFLDLVSCTTKVNVSRGAVLSVNHTSESHLSSEEFKSTIFQLKLCRRASETALRAAREWTRVSNATAHCCV